MKALRDPIPHKEARYVAVQNLVVNTELESKQARLWILVSEKICPEYTISSGRRSAEEGRNEKKYPTRKER
jgi:hypothetical protein